jgi:phospholipid transport system substrate-binding protein
MKRALNIAIIIALAAMVVTFVRPAEAAVPTEQLRITIDSILVILKDPNLKGPSNKVARRAKLSATVQKRFSFKEMSRRSLGKNWKERTPAEKKEFIKVFRDLIQNSYFTKMETYTDEKIVYDSERTKGKSSIIKTFVITSTATEIPINYRMKQNKKGEWMVYDIVVEGISLVSNYRSSFASELSKGSFGDLVASLKKKIAENK